MSIVTETVAGLLADLDQARITLRLEGDKVLCKGPRNAMSIELGQRLKLLKDAVREHLQSRWDDALAQSNAAIEEALTDMRLITSERTVLELYRVVAHKHHDNRDPALFGWADEVRYQMRTMWRLAPIAAVATQ